MADHTELPTVQNTFQPISGHINCTALGQPIEMQECKNGSQVAGLLMSLSMSSSHYLCQVAFVLLLCLYSALQATVNIPALSGGKPPVAMATGFLRQYQSMIQVRKQVCVCVCVCVLHLIDISHTHTCIRWWWC